MEPRRPSIRGSSFGGFGGFGGPLPRDLILLLVTVFVTFSFQFFATTAPIVALLRLSPAVWRFGFLWQLATYAFAGAGGASFWILLELLILYWFSRDVYWRLGKRKFRILLAWAVVGGALVAVLVELVGGYLPGFTGPVPFVLMQGQRMLIAIFVAAFATLFRDATIYLFFVLPIQARWFIPIEIAFAFIGFLGSRDLAGFAGLCAGVAITYYHLTGRLRGRRQLGFREPWLRLQEWWIRRKLDRLRKKRGFRVVEGERRGGRRSDDDDPWVH